MAIVEGLYLTASPYTLLTSHVKDVLISEEPRLLENLLLDGSPHIQSVGTASKIASISLFATADDAEAIDTLIAAGTGLTIKYLTKYATGYIRAVPKWANAGFRYYSADMEMVVQTTGTQT